MRTKLKQLLINKTPGLYISLSRGLAQFTHQREAQVLRQPRSGEADFDSAIYFTYYRCGSQVFKKVFRSICQATDETPEWIDFESYMMHREPEKGNIQDRIDEFLPAFVEKGFLYGPIYHAEEKLLEHPTLNSFCILRDPRDVLVSHYYSLGFAHTVTDQFSADRRRAVAAMTIDEFVLSPKYLDEVKERYALYQKRFIAGKGGDGFYRYEDMVRDLPVFMEAIVKRLNIKADSTLIQSVCRDVQTENKTEQKTSHRRSGKWGQFRKKLKPETVASLETSLGELIEPWQELA
ncbi:MAG: sulfotransferase domain-containing protein [Verrucomicrobiota bacterium JB023]|nr:sulfotransferase domain-containing protein [Verrucomicrobiota bacterium JB023]